MKNVQKRLYFQFFNFYNILLNLFDLSVHFCVFILYYSPNQFLKFSRTSKVKGKVWEIYFKFNHHISIFESQ